ncbi:MAG: mechanosensitive ion channel [Alphaproteobacteria bacterium]|nr:mechanosensitive ion channel [Alphaproteobacteria bacterium]
MRFLLKFVLLFCLGFIWQASAADLSRKVEFKKISEQLETLEGNLKNDKISVEQIDAQTTLLYEISNNLAETKRFNEREAKLVQKQLDAMGDIEEGGKELKELTNKRQELKDELSLLKSRIAETDILQVKIDNLNMQTLNFKSQKVLGNLVDKQEVLLLPQTFFASFKSLAVFFFDIVKSPVHWYQRLDESAREYVLTYVVPVIFILVAAIWLGLLLRRLMLKNWGYKDDIEAPNMVQKLVAAMANAVAYGLVPAFIISGFLGWMIGSKVFSVGFFGLVLEKSLIWLLYIVIARAVTLAVLAPSKENWRLIALPTKKAVKISHAINLSVLLIAVATVMEKVAIEATYEPILINLLTAFCSISKAIAIMLVTARIVSPQEESSDDSRSLAFRINILTAVLMIGTLGIGLFGYPNLCAYILNRYIFSAGLFGIFLIVKNFLASFVTRIFVVGLWGKSFHARRSLLIKINFILTVLVNPFLLLVLVFALLNLWGLSSEFLMHVAKKILFGFSIGGIKISLVAIVFGVVVFVVSYSLVKMFRNHLMQNAFTHLDVDEGIRHSLDSFVNFIGIVVSFILAIIAMGGNMTNLTVIAGALSVGIGFGLQNVINNFVSGIIILFERPFKVGDWVDIGGEEGKIKQINIRSTELETFKKTSVIVPNATLLSSSVINMTHGNNWTRLSVSVGVAYGTDVERVRDILLECANANPKVLRSPAPYVIFKDFGASSLDFDLRCYSNNIWEGWIIPSELRFAINKRFNEEGIEIPFQQIVVHQAKD